MAKKPDDPAIPEAAPALVPPRSQAKVRLGGRFDCLFVIYSRVPGLLGQHFMLWRDVVRVGSEADNDIILRDSLVSRRHAGFERRERTWWVIDGRSENGTYCNDRKVSSGVELAFGDRIKIGSTIFKLYSAAQWDEQAGEETYRFTVIDGLTGIHNNRYLLEALARELIRSHRHGRQVAILLFDIDRFAGINDCYGYMAGDVILAEIVRVVKPRLGRDHVFARRGPDSFVVVYADTTLEQATSFGESIRRAITEHAFVFSNETIYITVSMAAVAPNHGSVPENEWEAALVRRAEAGVFDDPGWMERNGR